MPEADAWTRYQRAHRTHTAEPSAVTAHALLDAFGDLCAALELKDDEARSETERLRQRLRFSGALR